MEKAKEIAWQRALDVSISLSIGSSRLANGFLQRAGLQELIDLGNAAEQRVIAACCAPESQASRAERVQPIRLSTFTVTDTTTQAPSFTQLEPSPITPFRAPTSSAIFSPVQLLAILGYLAVLSGHTVEVLAANAALADSVLSLVLRAIVTREAGIRGCGVREAYDAILAHCCAGSRIGVDHSFAVAEGRVILYLAEQSGFASVDELRAMMAHDGSAESEPPTPILAGKNAGTPLASASSGPVEVLGQSAKIAALEDPKTGRRIFLAKPKIPRGADRWRK